jgi:xylan 1,4-beta-xylosidase
MGIANQLRTIDDGFRIVASFPELKDRPIIIGESDPDGCAACQGPQLGYRNGTMYSSYTAASIARKHDLAERHGVNLEGALTWAFEFENQPLFAGFRVLATGGIDLPVLNVFRMFSLMDGERLPAVSSGAIALDAILKEGARKEPDVAALASRHGNVVTVLAWHYHDDDLTGPDADVSLAIAGLAESPSPALVHHYRIDQEHSNAFTVWKRMGSPPQPTPEQRGQLGRAGQLALIGSPEWQSLDKGGLTLRMNLPRQAVSLVRIELPR